MFLINELTLTMAKYARTIQHICLSARGISSCVFVPNKSLITWSRRFEAYHATKICTRTLSNSPPVENMPQDRETLNITDACVQHMKKIAAADEFLRVSVEGGGCSGFTYKFDIEKEIDDDDKVFEKDGIKVVSDEGSLALIKGSIVDFEEELIKSSFRLKDNPQSGGGCSCGVSFNVNL